MKIISAAALGIGCLLHLACQNDSGDKKNSPPNPSTKKVVTTIQPWSDQAILSSENEESCRQLGFSSHALQDHQVPVSVMVAKKGEMVCYQVYEFRVSATGKMEASQDISPESFYCAAFGVDCEATVGEESD